jgi:hypothetical protein
MLLRSKLGLAKIWINDQGLFAPQTPVEIEVFYPFNSEANCLTGCGKITPKALTFLFSES